MSRRIPSYRHHKARNCAVVTIAGKNHYLGPWQSPESKALYDQLIAEYLANGRAVTATPQQQDERDTITIVEVMAPYWDHCEVFYGSKDNRRTTAYNLKPILRELKNLYGDELAGAFDTLKLKTVRQRFIDRGQTRGTVNRNVDRIRKMFRWAASEKLIRHDVYVQLMTLERLQKGRTTAPEGKKVLPVSDEVVNATLAELSDVVADMVRVQQLTGARPDEVCMMRPCDIDRSGAIWEYVPESHKTEHHDKDRTVYIGPKAQDVLRPYLLRATNAHCFNPQEVRKGKRRGTRYTTGSYRVAIHRACRRAGVELWGPNRLRHSKATVIRKEFGLEAAQVTLGHANARVTEQYAERDRRLAIEVAKKIG